MVDLVNGFDHLPEEMRWAQQWCVAGPEKAPYSVNGQGLYRASVTDPSHWLDFETSVEAAQHVGAKVGYVISSTDSLTCIDLDVKDRDNEPDPRKWTTQEQLNRFWAIVQAFDSYTERSLSGKGLHIWVRGKIGKGCRRDGVEVYSQERFIICTGDVVHNKPIRECQGLLDILLKEIQAGQANDTADLVEIDATEPDNVIWHRAATAVNNDKFIPLCEGKWLDLGYPSQSEADLSLMSMFCFYSKSNEQCRRLFRMTKLGQREKAVKNNRYLDYTISRIRGRQEREDLAQADIKTQAEKLIERLQSIPQATAQQPAPAAVKVATMSPQPIYEEKGISWPPGFAGYIAGYIYKSAPRPVKEVAIVAALGLLAGICGKAFSIPQSGLNLYIILVARSAIGKEAMHSGIASLMESVRNRLPQAMNFVDFSDFASGPALSKAVAANSCFVNVAGEWGRKLRRLAKEDKNEGPMQQLRTVMTNLYQKSGPASIVGGITYSNKDQNIAAVSGVSYSMIGETTPSTLYESLTESMMDDGFLSRFTIIEYEGDRPPHNYAAIQQPDQPLSDALAQLCHHSLTLLHRNARQEVLRDDESAEILYRFDLECDDRINGVTDEAQRQMWNRAALKVTRIAALLAVADNFLNPVIQRAHVDWALEVVRKDIYSMQKKLMAGDVGVHDHSRERKVISIMRDHIVNGVAKSYNVPTKMIQHGVIPKKLILARTNRLNSFTSHRMGSTVALNQTLQSLIDSGDVAEVPKDILVKEYSYHGKCYRLIQLNEESFT